MLDGIRSDIVIGYHDYQLDYVKVTKGGNHLEHYYRDDELVGCTLNHHNILTNNGLIEGKVVETVYHNGIISTKGQTGDIRAVDLGNGTVDLYCLGQYIGVFSTASQSQLDNTELFMVSYTMNGYDVRPVYRDSGRIFFMLGFGIGSFPYNQIPNLSAIGLEEVVMSFSKMFIEGGYVTYMDKLFGPKIKEVVFLQDEDFNHGYRILAKIGNCYMKMMVSFDPSIPFVASIMDSEGQFHDYQHVNATVRNSYHRDLTEQLPELA